MTFAGETASMVNGRAKTPWLAINRPQPGAKLRLFCFPYSGAAASVFYPWASVLPPQIELCPVQYPGRGTRLADPLATRLSEMVPQLGAALLPYLDRPFAFFGHSLGALVSFELARWLAQRGSLTSSSSAPLQPGAAPGQLVHLFVSGHGAPHLPDLNPHIHDLPKPQFVEQIRQLNGTPQEVLDHPELMELLLPVLRADFELCETYVCDSSLPVSLRSPITACAGIADPYVGRAALQDWQRHTTAETAVRLFPGDHFYLHSSRHDLLQMIARQLSPYLG